MGGKKLKSKMGKKYETLLNERDEEQKQKDETLQFISFYPTVFIV